MRSPDSKNRGSALLILMMMATVLLVSLAAAVPNIYTAGQREKEEELIFRGNEYARAIIFFQRQFHRYPSSVDELIKKTNGFRFLRHAYPDPMSQDGKWRFIHADARGVVLDSRTLQLGVPSGAGQAPQPLQGAPPLGQGMNPGANPGQGSSSATGLVMGAFIVGVASSSTKNSIKVWNNRTRYDEWEFLAVGQNVGGVVAPGQPGGTTGAPPGVNPGLGPGAPQSPAMPPLTDQPISQQ